MQAGTQRIAASPPPVRSAVALYHHYCHDGIFAALAAHLSFKQSGTPVRFVPHHVYEALEAAALGLRRQETVFLLDFVGPPGLAQQLCNMAGRVVVVDHHKTATEQFGVASAELPANLEVNLDMERSGATMALDYFRPTGLTEAQQQLFQYVEDADLWRWKLSDSRQFHAGLVDSKLDYDVSTNPGVFDQLLQLTPDSLITRGRRAKEQQDRAVAAIIAESFRMQLGGARGAAGDWAVCLAARGDASTNLRSQIGNALALKARAAGLRPVGAVIYIEAAANNDGQYKVSLRSLGDEDTTVVSKALGGGGHRNASSFLADVQEVESWRLLD